MPRESMLRDLPEMEQQHIRIVSDAWLKIVGAAKGVHALVEKRLPVEQVNRKLALEETKPCPRRKRNKAKGPAVKNSVVCIEYSRGAKRVYKLGGEPDLRNKSFDIVEEEMTHKRRLDNMVADYLLPQGFPHSVAPQYQKYMTWRGIQYFFGGAMSVFTTRALLNSLGVANKHSGEAAAAINWVLKDGAGRMGRFLFARWGRSLDCELKQFRLAGDILMETGASLELSTALAPRLFLPLACTANLAKNLAAVAASSTRAPIYKTFARSNNMADITAKGESVANLADVFGTAFGILLAKAKLPTVPTFVALSAGYLLSSRKEVDSVELPYFNRARLSYVSKRFFDTGKAPDITEANIKEALLPWGDPSFGRIVLGASVKEACPTPEDFEAARTLFSQSPHMLTFRKDTGKLYVMLRQGASTEDVLLGAFQAQVFLHLLQGGQLKNEVRGHVIRSLQELDRRSGNYVKKNRASEDVLDFISKHGDSIFSTFKKQVVDNGWKMQLTMLNPKDARLSSP